MKKLTKKQRKQIERAVRRNLNESFKRNTTFLKKQLKETQESIDELTADLDSDLQEHHIKHRNSVFVPILDEATGEKTYEPRSFDEILAECENDKTADDLTRYDHLYDMLEESSEYEWNTYYADNEEDLSEIDIKKGIKDLGQKAKEKVKGGIETIKSAWKKGKIFFFFKTIEQGLKVALSYSKGFTKLIMKIAMKPVIAMISAWVKTKGKVIEVWNTFGNWMRENLPKLIEKIMSPFLWVAKKITGDMQKAAELAPVLLSIAVTSIALAVVYMTAGIDVAGSVASGTSESMKEVAAQLPNEIAAEMGCGAAAAAVGAAISESHILKEEFSCDIIDEHGQQVTDKVCGEVVKLLDAKIKDRATEVFAEFERTVEVVKDVATKDPTWLQDKLGIDPGLETTISVDVFTERSEGVAERARFLLGNIRSNLDDQGIIVNLSDPNQHGFLTDNAKLIRSELGELINQAQSYGELLPDAGKEELKDALDSRLESGVVKSVYERVSSMATENTAVEFHKEATSKIFTNITSYTSDIEAPVTGVLGAAEKALNESQVKRLKKLAGIV